jgi:hypothetical protein
MVKDSRASSFFFLPSFFLLNNDSLQFLTRSRRALVCPYFLFFVCIILSALLCSVCVFSLHPHLNIYLPLVVHIYTCTHFFFKFTWVFESQACYIAKRNCAFLHCCHLCHVKNTKVAARNHSIILTSQWTDKLFRVLNEISKDRNRRQQQLHPDLLLSSTLSFSSKASSVSSIHGLNVIFCPCWVQKIMCSSAKKNEKKVCIWWGLITTLDFIAARIHLHDSFIHSFSIGSKSHTVHGCHGMKMRVGRTDAVVVCVDARIQCGNGMRWRQ